MEEKNYKIAGKVFRLRDFDDYSPNEEKKIKILLGMKDDDGDFSVTISSKDNNDLLPILLVSDEVTDFTKFDFNDCPNGQLREIITDWLAARFFFTRNMRSSLTESLRKKLQLNSSTNPSTENQENLTPGS